MKWFFTILALLAGVTLSAKVDVVASNGLIADWVRQVGGDEVNVQTLANSGDLHQFEPSPRQIAGMAKAKLVVALGAGMEPWLDEALDASGSKAMVLLLTDTLDLMPVGDPFWLKMPKLYPDAERKPPCCKGDAMEANLQWAALSQRIPVEEHGHDHHHDHSHDHGDYDPHVWLDPQMALLMVLAINDALNEVDPVHADYFNERRARYLDQLIELDEWALARLAEIPVSRRVLISHHDNLRYFGRRYGFFTPINILGSASSEAADPSARHFTELLEVIEDFDVRMIFTDSQPGPLEEQLEREGRVQTVRFCANLGANDGCKDYIGMMRYNVNQISTLH